ncbi:hypothetical protein KUCAC02_011955 [Chaenocephalus aceratus]|uniref:Uncharacterized protein n=1 Tax=Chaenocephalus aceratus TaxID=36190 RepID=A0ACB9X999_CHAAC|nr:hypothetical protein KUCAC02_011955 [Chaenocephalus aceratus]
MESIKDRTRGIDICDAVCRSLDAYNVELTSMVGVTTDGAPAMVGRKAGAVSLLSDKVANNGATTEMEPDIKGIVANRRQHHKSHSK